MTLDPLKEHLEKIREVVKKDGFTVQDVQGAPGYAYTVGLSMKTGSVINVLDPQDETKDQVEHALDLPELLVVGLSREVAQTVLSKAALLLLDGGRFEAGVDYPNIFNKYPARFAPMPRDLASRHLKLLAALRPGHPPAECWQLLWPDPLGRFPGDPGMDMRYSAMQNLSFNDGNSSLPH